jgi:hypothetical protein
MARNSDRWPLNDGPSGAELERIQRGIGKTMADVIRDAMRPSSTSMIPQDHSKAGQGEPTRDGVPLRLWEVEEERKAEEVRVEKLNAGQPRDLMDRLYPTTWELERRKAQKK